MGTSVLATRSESRWIVIHLGSRCTAVHRQLSLWHYQRAGLGQHHGDEDCLSANCRATAPERHRNRDVDQEQRRLAGFERAANAGCGRRPVDSLCGSEPASGWRTALEPVPPRILAAMLSVRRLILIVSLGIFVFDFPAPLLLAQKPTSTAVMDPTAGATSQDGKPSGGAQPVSV